MTIQIGLQCLNGGSSLASTNTENKSTTNSISKSIANRRVEEEDEIPNGQGDFNSKLEEVGLLRYLFHIS